MQRLEEHLKLNTSTYSKVRTVEEAITFISPGSTIVVVGSGGGVNEPELLLTALEEQFLKKGTPGGLTLYHPNGIGNSRGGGSDHFAHKGFLQFVYGSHWSWAPRLSQMACEGAFGIAVWPQGVLSQLLRESAAGRPGILTHIGLGTYLDPRITSKSPGRQLKPELVELAGNIWLFYPAPTIDVALIRATTADEFGNLTMEHEGVILDVLSAAQAARHSGGKVIAQVKRLAQGGTLDPRLVRVPGNLIDAVVVDPDQRQSSAEAYNPGYSGELKVQIPQRSDTRIERVLIARRAALELWPGAVVNLGFGIADGVASIVAEEGVADQITFSIEQGAAGGVPAWGTDFGLMWNPLSIIDAPSQFDFYDGGGLDLAIVSFAQVDAQGNVNVSYFDNRLVGPGGFMNITQTAKTVVFCGTFTARGLHVRVQDGQLIIDREGGFPKFLNEVDEITFSAAQARARGQLVLYITERGVFRLGPDGLELIEIMPGISIERDIIPNMEFRPRIARALQLTPEEVYQLGPLGLAKHLAESRSCRRSWARERAVS